MKEIKAFIHRNRIADVVRALRQANFRNLSVIDVKGLLQALDSRETDYSIEIGDSVITEVKLELVCEDEVGVALAVGIIQKNGRTGQADAGWIYVSDIDSAYSVNDD